MRAVAETTSARGQPAIAAELAHDANATKAAADVSGRVAQAVRSGVLRDAVAELARNPTLGHISNPADHVNQVLDATLRSPDVWPRLPHAESDGHVEPNGRPLLLRASADEGLARIC